MFLLWREIQGELHLESRSLSASKENSILCGYVTDTLCNFLYCGHDDYTVMIGKIISALFVALYVFVGLVLVIILSGLIYGFIQNPGAFMGVVVK